MRGVAGGDDRADGSGGHAAGARFGRVLERVAQGFALAGGVMLLAVTALQELLETGSHSSWSTANTGRKARDKAFAVD